MPDLCYVRFIPIVDTVQMDEALKKYFNIAGFPYKVCNDSDFACVGRVLEGYGKRVKWKFKGSIVGRSIVDI